mgnify:CR=1 FL=1
MDILIKNALVTSITNARETLISLRNVVKDSITGEIFNILCENGFKGDGTYDFVSDELLDFQLKNIDKRFHELFDEYKTYFQMTYINTKEYDVDRLHLITDVESKHDDDGTEILTIYFEIYREDDFYDLDYDNPIYKFEMSYTI